MVKFKQALWRPFSDVRTLLLGVIISIIPVVNLATYGFGLACARKPYDEKLPGWKNFQSLWIEGLLATLIMILYLLPAIAVFSIGFFTDAYDIPILIATVILAIISYYLLPIAWVLFAHGRFKDAFTFGEMAGLCFHIKYFSVWLGVLVVSFIIAFVLNLLAALLSFTYVGPFIIIGFTAFWLVAFVFSIYGQLYQELG